MARLGQSLSLWRKNDFEQVWVARQTVAPASQKTRQPFCSPIFLYWGEHMCNRPYTQFCVRAPLDWHIKRPTLIYIYIYIYICKNMYMSIYIYIFIWLCTHVYLPLPSAYRLLPIAYCHWCPHHLCHLRLGVHIFTNIDKSSVKYSQILRILLTFDQNTPFFKRTCPNFEKCSLRGRKWGLGLQIHVKIILTTMSMQYIYIYILFIIHECTLLVSK